MSYLLGITIIFTILFMMYQRIVARKKRLFLGFTLFMIFLVLIVRIDRTMDNLGGLTIALVINYLFWLLIGRYNRVGDDQETIKVYGMDD